MKHLSPLSLKTIVFTAGIILFFLRLILLLTADPTSFLTPDSYEYLALRDSLLAGEGYSIGGVLHTFRPPGYPVFLFLLASIGLSSPVLIVFFQLILELFTLFLLYRITLLLSFSKPAQLLTLLAAYASPIMPLYAMSILSETLFLTFFLSSFLLLHRSHISSSFLLAVTMAALCYIRPIGLLLIVLYIVYCIMQKHKKHLLALCCSLILLLPWVMRTHNSAQTWTLGTVGDITFYRYHAAALQAKNENKSFEDVQARFSQQLDAWGSDKYINASHEWKSILQAHPLSYILIHLKGSLMLFFPIGGDLLRIAGLSIGSIGTLAIINSQGFIAGIHHYLSHAGLGTFLLLPLALFTLLHFLFALIGMLTTKAFLKNHTYLLILASSFLLIAITGPDSHPRFRMPITPFISLFAAQGFLFSMRRKT